MKFFLGIAKVNFYCIYANKILLTWNPLDFILAVPESQSSCQTKKIV